MTVVNPPDPMLLHDDWIIDRPPVRPHGTAPVSRRHVRVIDVLPDPRGVHRVLDRPQPLERDVDDRSVPDLLREVPFVSRVVRRLVADREDVRRGLDPVLDVPQPRKPRERVLDRRITRAHPVRETQNGTASVPADAHLSNPDFPFELDLMTFPRAVFDAHAPSPLFCSINRLSF